MFVSLLIAHASEFLHLQFYCDLSRACVRLKITMFSRQICYSTVNSCALKYLLYALSCFRSSSRTKSCVEPLCNHVNKTRNYWFRWCFYCFSYFPRQLLIYFIHAFCLNRLLYPFRFKVSVF